MDITDYNYRFHDDPVEDVAKGCMGTMGMIIALVLTLLLCMCSCTTTKYVEVPGPTHIDTTYITKWQHDSIYQRDSIHVTEKGDTVMIDRWHIMTEKHILRDTVFHFVNDTIPAPYPVEVEVPTQLTWWQRTRMHIGEVAIGFIAAALLAGIVWLILRLKGWKLW